MWTETHVPDHRSIDSDLMKMQTKCPAEYPSGSPGLGEAVPAGSVLALARLSNIHQKEMSLGTESTVLHNLTRSQGGKTESKIRGK